MYTEKGHAVMVLRSHCRARLLYALCLMNSFHYDDSTSQDMSLKGAYYHEFTMTSQDMSLKGACYHELLGSVCKCLCQ